MKIICFFLLIPVILGFACSENIKKPKISTGISSSDTIQIIHFDTIKLFDSTRNRQIPIAIYSNNLMTNDKKPILIFSHGYGKNNGQSYLKYSYLMNFFALNGYYVVSIQHENSEDPLLAMKGNIQELRLPAWERGCENISFLLKYLKRSANQKLDFDNLTLVGHSNGGDISALYMEQNQGKLNQLILLDNLRKQIPAHPKTAVLNIRAIDTKADEGVLQNASSKSVKNHWLVQLKYTKHGDMDDKANEQQQKEIMQCIIKFLKRSS